MSLADQFDVVRADRRLRPPPYFIIINRALRDEGTSYQLYSAIGVCERMSAVAHHSGRGRKARRSQNHQRFDLDHRRSFPRNQRSHSGRSRQGDSRARRWLSYVPFGCVKPPRSGSVLTISSFRPCPASQTEILHQRCGCQSQNDDGQHADKTHAPHHCWRHTVHHGQTRLVDDARRPELRDGPRST